MAENQTDQVQTSNQPEPVTSASDTQVVPQPQVEDGLHYASDQQSTGQGDAQQTPPATTAAENAAPEWDGKLETLDEKLQPRYKEMLRHMHQVSQEAASVKQKAQEYEKLASDPELAEFVKWKEGRQQQLSNPSLEASPQLGELTDEELLTAQNDPKAYKALFQRQLSAEIAPLAQQFSQRLEAMERTYRHDRSEREIESFAAVHPDFYEIDPIVLKAALEEVVVQNKGTLLDAYNRAKDVEKSYLDKARTSINQTVQQKKAGVTAAPSNGVQPEIVYAPDSRTANTIAAQYAAQGKTVDVRVKRK